MGSKNGVVIRITKRASEVVASEAPTTYKEQSSMNPSNSNDAIPALSEQWASVPDELKSEKAWLLWRKVPKPNKPGKFDKVPHYTNGEMRKGIQGSEKDKANLVTFKNAVKALEKSGNKFAGLGIAALPGSTWSALDLDGVDEHPEAQETGRIAEYCGAYVENSPSGKGLRAFIKRTGLGHRARHDLGVELFEDTGFVTVTGDVTHHGTVAALPDTAIAKLKNWFGDSHSTTERTPPPEWERFDLLTLPIDLQVELQTGYGKDEDRSVRIWSMCVKLARTGLSAEEAFNIFGDTNLPWLEVGLDRRNGSVDKAQYWIWQYCVKRAYEKEQARANERQEALGIGETNVEPEPFPILTLDEMLGRFVYLTMTNEICDLLHPRLAMPLAHARNLTASSRTEKTPTINLWNTSPERHVIETRTWRPGHDRYLKSPKGDNAVNIWMPPSSALGSADEGYTQMFLDHIEYLCPVEAERERFLDWLAHIQQQPGELVHSHYLMIAPNTQGIGRNWLASLLSRVWAGNVALSVNFSGIMSGSFNGDLSERTLAVVDELHEGGGGMWALAEGLKTELTREHRLINPKYGRQHLEFNCIRWLMFSNSMMALPLTTDDRRFWVIENPSTARNVEYYERIYGALKDPSMVSSVRAWLAERNLIRFKPGERPVQNAVKREMIANSLSTEDSAFDRLVADWPSDLITGGDLNMQVFGDMTSFGPESSKRGKQLKHMLARVRGKMLGRMRVDKHPQTVYALRNAAHWEKLWEEDKEAVRRDVPMRTQAYP